MGALLKGHSRAGDIIGTASALRDMATNGMEPDVVAWTSLLSACARAPKGRLRTEVAEATLCGMLESSVSPNAVAWRELGRAVGTERRGELIRALGTPHELDSSVVLRKQ